MGLGSVLCAAGILAAYALLLAWFNYTDWYHRHFFDPGVGVVLHTGARLLLIPFFAWLVYAAGVGAICLIWRRNALSELPPWERYPLGFLAGAGVWHLVMFAFGLAGLYSKPLAFVLVGFVTVLSLPHLAACLAELGESAGRVRIRANAETAGWLLLAAAIIAATALLLLLKVLYPFGSHDYFSHYLPHYRAVIREGSILPNDVWYHFYYTKGAGLYFLGILLTDLLAPELMAAGFLIAAAFMVYGFLRRATSGRVLPWVGVLLYLAVFIHTPGPDPRISADGWGILGKMHELTAVLILGVVWLSYRLSCEEVPGRGVSILALVATVITTCLLTLPLGFLIGAFLAGYLCFYLARRQWRMTVWPLIGGITALASMLAIAVLNYHYTGLPLDQGLLVFWRYADLNRLQEGGVLFEVMWEHFYTTDMVLQTKPWGSELILQLFYFLRLELWAPVALAGLPLMANRLRQKGAGSAYLRAQDSRAWAALLGFSCVVVLVALFGGGRSQFISFYRFSSFTYAPTLCLTLLPWNGAPGPSGAWTLRKTSLVVGGILLTLVLAWQFYPVRRFVRDARAEIASKVENNLRLITGEFSLKDVYQHPKALTTGIYPGLETPARIVGPNTRVWSLQIIAYCMLPDCNFQHFYSNRFSAEWPTIYFGSPAEAEKSLRAEKLDYFYFSTQAGTATVWDPLISAPLFSPDHIGEHLAIRWTDGDNYLLTWPGPGTHPVDGVFLANYRKAIAVEVAQRSPWNRQYLENIEGWKHIGTYVSAHRGNMRSFRLPWCIDCAGLPSIESGR